MFIVTTVLAALLAAGFVAAGLPKVLAQPAAVDNARQLGYSQSAFRLIGLLELAGSAGLLIGLYWAPLGVAAAAGLALLTLGAVITHLRRKDPVKVAAPAVLYAVASIAVLVLRLTTA
jgi:uncharacterized membrane protein YphA (DoxX/SURF4 family)